MKGSTYERQTKQVLTGGWNPLLPGDMVSDSEALQVQNFVVNSAGNLRSRYGHGASVWTPGPVQSFQNVHGSTLRRYSACYDGHLWRNGADLGLFTVAGNRIGMVSYQGYLWALSRTNQQKDNGSGLLAWSPAAPPNFTATILADSGALVHGSIYTYWVTYTAPIAGFGTQESPSNAAGFTIDAIVAPNQAVAIPSPPNPGDAQRTHYNVYKVGGTLQNALRINREPIPLDFEFIDTGHINDALDDYSVTQLGITLDADSAGPPAGDGLAGPYFDRLLAWGTLANPNRLFWSGQLQPYNFPGSDLDEGNHVDIGEFGEEIVGVTIRPRTAIVYKQSSIWRMYGDPGDLDGGLEHITSELGPIGRQGIIQVGGMDYFQGREGIYSFNGDRAKKISAKIDPLFKTDWLDFTNGFPYPAFAVKPVQLSQIEESRAKNHLAHRNGRLYFFYCGEGSSVPNQGVTCEVGADNWGSDSRSASAMLDEGSGTGLLLASISDSVYVIEEGFSDGGAPIQLAYQTGFKNQDAPENLKTYVDVEIQHNTGGCALEVWALYNNDVGPEPPGTQSTRELLGIISSTRLTTSTFQCDQLGPSGDGFAEAKLGVKAFNIAIRFEGNAATTDDCSIFKIHLHYFVEPRDSKTYDSDETDLGDERVKQVFEIEWDIDIPGGTDPPWVDWAIYTNIDADGVTGPMAQRQTGAIAGTGTRRVVRRPLFTGIAGRLIRVVLRADATSFRLHGCRVRVLPIGEWIDPDESPFQSVEINIGAD